jgi:hypothetical protein
MQGDCSSRITAEECQSWWHEDDEQGNMGYRACCRAAATFVFGGTLSLRKNQSVVATLRAIKKYLAWTTMTKNFKLFVQNCLHGVATISKDVVSRPLDTQPNETLHLEFL